jgi:hypothetical protein
MGALTSSAEEFISGERGVCGPVQDDIATAGMGNASAARNP